MARASSSTAGPGEHALPLSQCSLRALCRDWLAVQSTWHEQLNIHMWFLGIRYFSGTNQYSLVNMHWWNDTQARTFFSLAHCMRLTTVSIAALQEARRPAPAMHDAQHCGKCSMAAAFAPILSP